MSTSIATAERAAAMPLADAAAWTRRAAKMLLRAAVLGLLAFLIFGPILNMLLWTVAERWYFPAKLPISYGFTYWERVFAPRGNAIESLVNSVLIALGTVCLSLALAVPAGYAIARLRLPWRGVILLTFLLPQAFPNLPVYINIARIFYEYGLNGTYLGVILVHTVHGLVYAIWIATAAFAAVDHSLEEAARISGAGPLRAFFDVTLPLATPGLMASAIFVFLESLDEFTGTFFVGVPEVNTLPLLLYTASAGGNYQIASITALILLVPSIAFMLMVERFLKADVLAKVGR
jgi:ABC-type spermidine/putrescine transport system permease subunit II